MIANKDYLVTTGDAVQSIELKYLELILQRPEDEAAQKRWETQIEGLNKLLSMFRNRADAVIDEVHQGLLLKRKLNYAFGMKRAVPPHLIMECVEIYRFFDHIELSDVLGNDFAGKTHSDLMKNNQLVTDDKSWNKIMVHLARQLVEQDKSPLQNWIKTGSMTEKDKQDLLNYFANEGSIEPPCVRQADAKMKSIFALYKEQVGQLEHEGQLLPRTLRRKLNEHYGASRKPELDATQRALAIPYLANNVPSERSRFGNFLELINFSIQRLMIEGLSKELLKAYLGCLQEQAREELRQNPELGAIDNTPTAKGFEGLVPASKWSLSQIRLDDDKQFDLVFSALRENKNILAAVLQQQVLPQIEIDAEILHSDACNHVSLYRSCQGITGTPSNSHTYHQRLAYNSQTAVGTDGLILAVLTAKNTAINAVDFSTTADFLKQLFVNRSAEEGVRAIIDVAATFKGVSNIEVAKALATYIQNNSEQFAQPLPIKYILFFNADNVLTALDVQKARAPIIIGSSDADEINRKLGCTPEERFSYYDQVHTEGVDLKQAKKAKGLVLIDHETELTKFLQGSTRLRGLVQGEQCIEIITPRALYGQSLDDLFKAMNANEKRQIKRDSLPSGQTKMTDVIRANFMRRLLTSDHSVLKQHQMANAFKAYFVELDSGDFFARYGGLVSLRDAKKILEEQRERLIKDWSSALTELGEAASAAEEKALRLELNNIIASTLDVCDQKYLSPTRHDQGKEVEIQKQVQVERQKEAQKEGELFNSSLEPAPYKSWISKKLNSRDFLPALVAELAHNTIPQDPGRLLARYQIKTLTTLCSQSLNVPPDFGDNIYASKNFYQAYKGQTTFMDAFIKPVHALLFHLRADKRVDCMLVSQEEAEEMTALLERHPGPNCWLSTTRHTVLAGQPPEGIKDNKSYQETIEKIRFFNGEFRLLLESDKPLEWLHKNTTPKLSFFEQNLWRYRETEAGDIDRLRQDLSQKKLIFRYIVDNPLQDYTDFDWQSVVNQELSETEIEELETMSKAIRYANTHWQDPDFSINACYAGLRLPIQAVGYLHDYVKSLQALGEVLQGTVTLNDAQALLPSFLKKYLPSALSKKQTLLQCIVQKASHAEDPLKLLDLAKWLFEQGADVNAIDSNGCSALDLVIRSGGAHMQETLTWLLANGAQSLTHDNLPEEVTSEIIDQSFVLVMMPAFRENEQFLVSLAGVCRSSEEKLQELLTYQPQSSILLRKIVDVMRAPTQPFLQALLANDQFKTSAPLVRLLLERVPDDERQNLMPKLIEKRDELDFEVLMAIVNDSLLRPEQADDFIKRSNRDPILLFAMSTNNHLRPIAIQHLIALREKSLTTLSDLATSLKAQEKVFAEQLMALIKEANKKIIRTLQRADVNQLDYIKSFYMLCIELDKLYESYCANPMAPDNLEKFMNLEKKIKEAMVPPKPKSFTKESNKKNTPDAASNLNFWQRWLLKLGQVLNLL